MPNRVNGTAITALTAASACELADRVEYTIFSPNLNEVLNTQNQSEN
jgi:hypothetical protein